MRMTPKKSYELLKFTMKWNNSIKTENYAIFTSVKSNR